MLKVTWRNLVARKLRLLLSAFAIVLGVAFVAGTLVFTNALGSSFDQVIEGSTADVEVAPEGADDFDALQDVRTVPAALVDKLAALPQVEAAYGGLALQSVYVIGSDGKVVGGNGPPGLAFNDSGVVNMAGDPVLEVVDGAAPEGTTQVALARDTAEKAGVGIGDEVELVTSGDPPTKQATVSGIVDFGGGSLNGATITVFDTAGMQQLFFGGENVFNTVSLTAADGVSQAELVDAAQAVLPKGVRARTGDAVVQTNQQQLDELLGFLRTFLLAFAAVSLLVGTLLIINTFSILVAQRSRDLALLRAMGASRRQVNTSVLTEAAVVGLIGSVAGIGLGYLLALLLRFVVGQVGLDLSDAEFPLTVTAVIWSFVVGVVVTVLAALLPAVRASRIAPVAAMRDDVALSEGTLRTRTVVGFGLILLGAGAAAFAFTREGDTAALLLGLGVLGVLVGAFLASAVIGRPVIGLFGALFRRLFGTVGNLATENALRNPRRTGATASALMIGLALMSSGAVFAASARASTDAALEQALTSQFVVSNVVQAPFSPAVAREIRQLDGVAGVAALRQAFPKVGGGTEFVGAIDPRDVEAALSLPVLQGSLDDLGPGTVAVDAGTAREKGLALGDTVAMTFQAGKQDLRVAAVFTGGAALNLPYLVTPETFTRGGLAPLDSLLFITKSPDADTDAVRAEIEKVIADLPTVTVKDPEGFADEQKGQINTFLAFIYGLLGLAVIIAFLGVINTLSLSVIERTREVGLLRAVGTSRRQLRTIIRLESVAVAVYGAVLGLIIGTLFGIGLVRALRDEGLGELAIPWGQSVLFLIGAAVVGVLAAVIPARRAARLDVLRAITAD